MLCLALCDTISCLEIKSHRESMGQIFYWEASVVLEPEIRKQNTEPHPLYSKCTSCSLAERGLVRLPSALPFENQFSNTSSFIRFVPNRCVLRVTFKDCATLHF